MTKRDLIKFLEPFDGETEIKTESLALRGAIVPAKVKYMPSCFADDYAYILIQEDLK